MSMRTVELVSEWDAVSFDGGYGGLHSLSDRDFSGAVTAGSTQLFMLNGTVVGVLDGDIEAFDGTDGTARAAPHDALPLLVVMQDRADTPRAQYYTEDTPIADVDRTLEDGSFTGFVELSENVLSGDYYLVYHQGRSMTVAWVGNSQRLVTDEEAFEQADGEVGIYQVMPADIEPVEIPEPPEPNTSTGGEAAGMAAGSGTETPDDTAAEGTPEPATEPGSAPTDERGVTESEPAEPSQPTDSGSVSADSSERGTGAAGPPGSKAAGASQGTAVDGQQHDETAVDDPETDSAGASAEATEVPASPAEEARTAREHTASAPDEAGTAEPATGETERSETRTPSADAIEPRTDRSEETAASERTGDGRTAAAAADSDAVDDLETRSIPSLDPERSSSTVGATTTSPQTTTTAQTTPSQQSTPSHASPAETASTSSSSAGESESAEPTTQRSAEPTESEEPQPAPSPELEAEIEEREAEIAELEAEKRELSTENEELAAERDRLLSELEEARAEIQRLEDELAAAGGAAPNGRSLSAAEAIDGTNLFVRYHSKGEATLAKAQEGSADRASVEENLRLEYHTQFDADEAAVDGDAFGDFLHDSIQYRFVDWLVRNLLYEVRDTGHESAMGVLYDALPDIDRAELNGNVSVTYTEDGQEHRSQETFDVVVRDRMGNPLVVANINDARQPATDGQMTDIVRNAERVGNASDSLAAAFLVTSSFFEPEALETATEATSSGLFSRDTRKSFVNLSRKGGYHLCLLEARNKEFHLAVPEL